MTTKVFCLLLGFLLTTTVAIGQKSSDNVAFSKKMRVIIDNDFSGDPDGLFALTHLLLSPSVETRGIIGSHIHVKDFLDPSDKQADNAAYKAKEVLELLHMQGTVPVLTGSNTAMLNDSVAVKNEAVDFIVTEALRSDTKLPLYILCGAGLTEVASALLTNPAIAGKFTLVWIGGPEYADISFPAPLPNNSKTEYNLTIDKAAARVIFNKSTVSLWQIPRDAYRQVIVPYSQLLLNVKNKGSIGNYLHTEVVKVMNLLHNTRETYILGDSPLVLFTALQSYFEPDPASSSYQKRGAPKIDNQGQYANSETGRLIRVYVKVDSPLIFSDLFAKLELFSQPQKAKK